MKRRFFFGAAVAAPLFILGLIFLANIVKAITLNGSLSVNISAQVDPPGVITPPSGGAGGGGGGGSISPAADPNLLTTTGVVFIGKAYPSSNISLLQNGRLIVRTISGPDASFLISLSNATPGSVNYLIVAEDPSGHQSSFNVPVVVTEAATTTVSGIFISPTIDVDKNKVKLGDNVTIFGRSVPQSDVTISVNSETNLFLQTKTDNIGSYLYMLDTSKLEVGQHNAKSKTAANGQISDFSQPVGFSVVDKNAIITDEPKEIPKDTCNLAGDLNKDCKVDLIDFSIMAYWYKRVNPPKEIDLNHDNKINLADFSILASQWTG